MGNPFVREEIQDMLFCYLYSSSDIHCLSPSFPAGATWYSDCTNLNLIVKDNKIDPGLHPSCSPRLAAGLCNLAELAGVAVAAFRVGQA